MANVLLVVLDAVRKDHLTPYGHSRQTSPHLDAFAEEATRYDQAIAAAPWTPPSHASLFTGKYPSNHGVFGRQPNLDAAQPTLAERLSEAGYTTLGYSNSFHTSAHRGFDRGFDHYHDMQALPRIGGRWFEPNPTYLAFRLRSYTRGDDLSWYQLNRLRRRLTRTSDPFFAFINLNSAHSGYEPPPPYRERFEAEFDAWDQVDEEVARAVGQGDEKNVYQYMLGDVEMTETEWELLRCWYDGEIAYMDDLLGDFFDFLRSRGLYEETAIVITSDHGEHFGEHGLANHQFSLSETLINVPLLIKWPGQTEGTVNGELVSLTDLAPTALGLADAHRPDGMDGRDLRAEPEPEAVFAEYGRPNSDILSILLDRMFESFDITEESISAKLAAYKDRIDRFDRGLQAVRTPERKLVVGSDDERRLCRLGDGEKIEATDSAIARSLADRLDDSLGNLPEGSRSEDLPPHVERHLRKMGYM